MRVKNKEDRYSTVRYNIRKALQISLAEYCYCDITYHLAASRKAKTPGWANASNAYYADQLGMTERGIRKLKNRMIDKDLIERHPAGDEIRTTEKWEDAHQLGYVPEESAAEEQPAQEKEPPAPPSAPKPAAPSPELSSADSEQSSALPGTKFRPARNKVPPYPELSSAYSNRDSNNNRNRDSYSNSSEAASDLLSIQIFLMEKNKGREDSIPARGEILQLAEQWMETDDFETNWSTIGIGLPDVNRKEVVRDFILLAGWDLVRTFKFSKIRGWIRTAGQTAQTTTNGKRQANDTGQPFQYGPGSGQF